MPARISVTATRSQSARTRCNGQHQGPLLGGSGFIGRQLAAGLGACSERVRISARHADCLSHPQVELIKAGVLDDADVASAVRAPARRSGRVLLRPGASRTAPERAWNSATTNSLRRYQDSASSTESANTGRRVGRKLPGVLIGARNVGRNRPPHRSLFNGRQRRSQCAAHEFARSRELVDQSSMLAALSDLRLSVEQIARYFSVDAAHVGASLNPPI